MRKKKGDSGGVEKNYRLLSQEKERKDRGVRKVI